MDTIASLLDELQQDGNEGKKGIAHVFTENRVRIDGSGNFTFLNLMSFRLCGELSSTIGNLTSLRILYLAENNLIGPVPCEIGHLYELRELDLSCNKLTGNIPPTFSALINLKKLYAYGNMLSGPLPGATFGDMISLEEVDLSYNGFTGPIPEEFGKLGMLQKLYLMRNDLGGSIPDFIGGLKNLTSLDLSNTSLTGEIPDSIGALGKLTELNLYSNHLCGRIPPAIGNLLALREFNLSDNELCGVLPEELSQLSNIQLLILTNNRGLTGAVPRGVTCLMYTNGTDLHQIKIRLLELKTSSARMNLIVRIILSYVDLALDVLVIIQFVSRRQNILALIDTIFLLLNILINVCYAPGGVAKVVALFQLQPLHEGIRSLREGRETEVLTRSKKTESIARSIPSSFVQLYGYVMGLGGSISRRDDGLLLISIAFSIAATSATLSTMAPKSTPSKFSTTFVLHMGYYICEIICRVGTVSMLYVSLKEYALIIYCVDFLFRLHVYNAPPSVQVVNGRAMIPEGDISTLDLLVCALMSMGSAAWNGFDERYKGAASFNFFLTLTSLILMNVLHSEALGEAKEQGALAAITATICAAWALTLMFEIKIDGIVEDLKDGGEEKVSSSGAEDDAMGPTRNEIVMNVIFPAV